MIPPAVIVNRPGPRGRGALGVIVRPKHSFPAAVLVLAAAGASLALGQDAPPAEPNPTAVALQEAKDAFKKGSWQEALDAANRVLALQPKDLESLYIAGASERQTSRLTDAQGHLTALVETSPNFPLAHFQLGYVLFLRAEGLTREGQVEPAKAKYVEAATEFGKELGRSATHGASLSSRAIALSRAGLLAESVQAHEAWIAAVPQKNDPVVSLAATLAGAGRVSDAMSALERLPDKSPKAAFDAQLGTAAVFAARRDWGAAVPFLEKAVISDANSTRARGLLTEACARSGLATDAVRNLQALLTMDPTPDEAESVGEALKAAMGDGKSTPSVPGTEPPSVIRLPAPRFPKGQGESVQTEVLVLTLVQKDGTVGNMALVPNRIWKDIRTTGFEAAAFDAARRGKYSVGTKNGQPEDLWIVVPVKFARM